MENDTFGGAILAWVKNPRHATHAGENARSPDLVSIRYTKLEAHRHIGGDADNAIVSYRKVLGMYDVGFSETFERLVSIALARLDFNRHNLEILPLWRIHPLCRTSGATILALHDRAIHLFSE
jgi:hypothetical protein